MMMASTLAAALLAQQPSDGAVPQGTVTNHTVFLVTLSARQAHLGHGRHVAVALSDTGDVAGAVLTKRGKTVCSLEGFYDARSRCLTLAGCGFDRTACA